MGVAAIWTLIKLSRPVIDGIKEAIQSARATDENQTRHRTDIDMSVRSIVIVFFVMFASLPGIFYSFVSAEGLPVGQTLTFVLSGVLLAVIMGFLVGTSSSPISGIGILGIIISSPVMMALCNAFGIFDLANGEKSTDCPVARLRCRLLKRR